MEDETLKPSGTGSPTGDNEPTTANDPDFEKEIDSILASNDAGNGNSNDGDDEVVVTKKELDKLKADKENYKNGLLSIKDKYKSYKKNSKPAPTATPTDPLSKPLTMNDLHKLNEDKAVEKVQNADSIVKEHWKEISKYYRPVHGKNTPEAIEKDIKQAKLLFLDDNPDIQDKEQVDKKKKAISDLGSDSGKSAGTTTSTDKAPAKKSVLAKPTPVKEWYS